MWRRSALLLAAMVATVLTIGAAELPQSDADDEDAAFEVEPPLLIPNRATEPSSDTPTPKLSPDVERLEQDLERAERNAQAAERLFKSGVLARAEVEQRGLRVIRLQSQLANARLVRAKEYADSQHSRAASGEISKAELAESEQLLNRAIEEARLAGTSRDKAEVDAAEMNLRRQQKLLQLGSARKSEVIKAEQRLADVKAHVGN